MPDVATLGLEVRSDQVEKGARSLDGLTNAAKRAEAAANGVSAATRNVSAAAVSVAASSGQAAASLNAEAAAAQKAAGAMRLHASAANSNVKAAGSLNTANIAAQFQDIAVSAQMGMGALQIGLQQGTQLAAVIGSMERPLHGLGAAFLSVISPVSLLVIGLTTLAAVGLQNVNWARLAQGTLRALANSLEAVAPYATAAAAALALFYAPQLLGGLVQLIALMARLTVQAGIMAGAFALANPATVFAAGVAAAAVALIYFGNTIKKTFGVDVLAAAKNGANYVIGAFVAAFNDLRTLWGNFPDIMEAAAIGAVNGVIRALNSMIEKVRAAFNEVIGLANNIPGVNISTFGTATPGIPELANPAAERLSGLSASRNSRISQDMSRDYLGSLGRGVATGAREGVAALRELADWMTTVDEKAKKSRGKTEADKYAEIVDGANRRIASLKAEAASLGMTEEEALKLRHTQDLLNQAQQKGITLTAAQRAELAGLAGEMARIEVSTQRVKAATDFANQSTYSFFRGIVIEGQSARQALGNVLMSMADDLLKFAITGQGALAGMFGGSSSGGLFGLLLRGLFGGVTGAAAPAGGSGGLLYGGPRAFGGNVFPGSFYTVGERGPETFIPRVPGRIMPNNDNAGRGVSIVNHIDASGADPAAIARLEKVLARQAEDLRRVNSSVEPRAVRAMQQYSSRGVR